MAKQIEQLMATFRGLMSAHGTHGDPYQEPNKNKWEIKRSAKTLREPVTAELWEKHISGDRPLGIISICEDNTCYWGSIDVDRYDIDLFDIIKKVEKAHFPLIPCRSKSGGLHLFLFLLDPQPAGAVQTVLRDMAASLGLAGSEIFPKQTQILTERGDLGSWMVMPYFGSTYGGKLKEQVGLKKSGAEMTLSEFLSVAAKNRVTADEFQRLGSRKKANGKEIPSDISDGPPCLQHLAAVGFPEGTRNNSLFHYGVYARKKYPGDWQKRIEAANQEYMRPPLTTDEIAGVIKSLNKKTYEYTCKVEPMASHCDSQLCRARRFGVGDAGNLPIISGITKLDTDPPIWFVDIGPDRLECTTEELFFYRVFQVKCMAELNQVFMQQKQEAWVKQLNEQMENVVIQPAAPEIGLEGRFLHVLQTYLTNSATGEAKEDLLLDRPWEDEQKGQYYFTLNGILKAVKREDLRDERGHRLSPARISRYIQKLGGEGNVRIRTKHDQVRVWWVPSSIMEKTPIHDNIPEVPGAPI